MKCQQKLFARCKPIKGVVVGVHDDASMDTVKLPVGGGRGFNSSVAEDSVQVCRLESAPDFLRVMYLNNASNHSPGLNMTEKSGFGLPSVKLFLRYPSILDSKCGIRVIGSSDDPTYSPPSH